MKIVLAPNSFRDALAAPAVARAMAVGVERAEPAAEVVQLPLADGGDGTLEVLAELLSATLHTVTVTDSLGRPVEARLALADGGRTAILEMAEANGLRRLTPAERDPLRSHTGGTGEMIRAALDLGARQILLGAGGSATIDGGTGALAALGAVFRDAGGDALDPSPAALTRLATLDLTGLDPRLRESRITVLADVSTSLERHVRVYGEQKGAAPEDRPTLEAHLARVADLAASHGHAVAGRPWYGAAGCMAGGLAAFAGAQVVGGGEEIVRHANLRRHLADADLVLSGEGRVDASSFEHKLPAVVAATALEVGVPLILLAGQLDGARALPGVVAAFSLSSGPEDLSAAIARTAERLTETSEQIVRLFSSARRPVEASGWSTQR
ncbi:MAG: glycerate kinase [Acidobacteria bacterium]|nr:glycerate kinase [Acidobacteriota bacterium]